jgi:hypothetical protein
VARLSAARLGIPPPLTRHSSVVLASEEEDLMDNLSLPQNDGAADHLPGRAALHLHLPSTTGKTIRLDALGPGRTVLYIYPLTGRLGTDLPPGLGADPRSARLHP